MSNINRRTEELADGGMAEEVEKRKKAAAPYVEAKCREQQTSTIFGWLGDKGAHIFRQLAGEETYEDHLKKYESVEVQLFGIPLFNTKDAVSERLWSMAASQGETVTGWPLKAAAWIAKKMERTGALDMPPEAPMTSETHVLLENTRYHKRYDKDVEKRVNNALDRLHQYVTSNFLERNSSVWLSVREEFETDKNGGDGAETRIMTQRSYKKFDEEMRERLNEIAELEQNATDTEADTDTALASLLSSLSIRDRRKAVEEVFSNHGGGELRIVAKALNISIPSSLREWLDDPYANEEIMGRLLRHPRVAKQLTHPDIGDEPVCIPLD